MTDFKQMTLDLTDSEKETTMTVTTKTATKRTTKRATNKKETNMPKTNTKTPKTEPAKNVKTGLPVPEIKRRFFAGAELVAEMYNHEQPICKVFSITAKTGVINHDPKWVDAVRYIAAEMGWLDPRFVYKKKAIELGGTPKDDAYAIPSFIQGFYRPVYNVQDIEWPDGKVPDSVCPLPDDVKKDIARLDVKPEAPKPAAPNMKRVILPDGTILEAMTTPELLEMKAAFA